MFCEDRDAYDVKRCVWVIDAPGNEVLKMAIEVVSEPEFHCLSVALFDFWSVCSEDGAVLLYQVASEEGAHITSDTVGCVVYDERDAVSVK